MKFDAMKDFNDSVMLSEYNAITTSKLLDTPCQYVNYLTDLYFVSYTTETYQDPIIRMATYFIGDAHTIYDDGTISTYGYHVMVMPCMLGDAKVDGNAIFRKIGDHNCVKIMYAVFFDMTANNAITRFVRKFNIDHEWANDISPNMETRTLRDYYTEKYVSKQTHAFNKMKVAERDYESYKQIVGYLRDTTD